jgi:flagellin
MGFQVNNTIPSILARQAGDSANRLAESQNRLSSLLRINQASDDASGLAIAERFRTQIRENTTEINSFQTGINLVQTAESGLATQSDAVSRVRELAVQAANGTLNDDQRATINAEAQEIIAQIDDTAQQTTFNGISPLEAGTGEVALDAQGDVSVEFEESTVQSLGLDTVDLSTQQGAQDALAALDAASEQINSNRANLGASQNGLSSSIAQREVATENFQAAESAIRDLDVGREFLEQARNEILLQTAVSSILQANVQNDTASRLLGG